MRVFGRGERTAELDFKPQSVVTSRRERIEARAEREEPA